ncbi:hypothetical protein KIW84_012729 [Lathyrus oleraceus]|uniref:Uncharacterized protein n=1 Tax=Pisum sativum TaxID=3888 RepID=A0A9D5GX33_PEA|nr:hypothetical protein KIW84_012729 [Pisum sativum]
MQINKLGVNLAKLFDETLAHREPNIGYDTRLEPNDLFDDSSEDESYGYSSESDSAFEGGENLNATDYTNNKSSDSVKLPLLKQSPKALQDLFSKMDHYFNNDKGPPNSRIQGQSCHRHCNMLPIPGYSPKFTQLYIYDIEKDIQNRIHRINTDGRIYNQPTVSEVAILITGDVNTAERRDIIMQKQYGEVQRIDGYHTSYLGYQYPLFFPYGEDGYRPNVKY